jgi:hypothetical protein
VLAVLDPASGFLTQKQALDAYRRMPAALQLRGRTVKTVLARVAYIRDGLARTTRVWVISVWYHPPRVGVAPQQGCLPNGRRPVDMHVD